MRKPPPKPTKHTPPHKGQMASRPMPKKPAKAHGKMTKQDYPDSGD